MAFFWFSKGILESKDDRLFSFIITCFLLLSLIFKGDFFRYLYPVLVNGLLFIIFSYSLKSEPIITKFAKIKDKDLPKEAIIYTRKLTLLWAVFFLTNGLISLILAFLENKHYWAIFCGMISYILVGGFIGFEYIYRIFFIKRLKT